MKQVAITLFLLFFALNCFAEIKPERTSVFFETGSYTLTNDGKQVLDSLISTIRKGEDLEVFLDGHTDNVGASSYNDELSSNRVSSVQQYLLNQGVEAEILVSNYFGENKPEVPNTTERNKSQNRRVELRIIRYSFSSIDELDEMLATSNTKIEIDPNIPNTVQADQGTTISFEAGSFLDQNGNVVKQEVAIEVTEALDLTDFIAHDLMTVSGNQMLESGGMMKITATSSDGELLQLDPNKPMQVNVPSNKLQDGMTVFTSESGSDWSNTSNPVRTSQVSQSDAIFNVENRVRLYFKQIPYPQFSRDMASRPEYPLKPFPPHPPKEPLESSYLKKLEWHEKAISPIIRARQKKKYADAYARYLVKLDKYRERQERYEAKNRRYYADSERYKIDYQKWLDRQINDSINFKDSEAYQKVARRNKQLYEYYDKLYEGKLSAWQREVDSKMEEKDVNGEITAADMSSYMFTYNRLSWINIDRFYKLPVNQARPITMLDTDETGEKVVIVFEDIRSTLPLGRNRRNGKKFVQDRIPKKADATLLAYKVIDGQVMVYHEKIGKQNTYKPEYKPYKFKEFKELLKNLQA